MQVNFTRRYKKSLSFLYLVAPSFFLPLLAYGDMRDELSTQETSFNQVQIMDDTALADGKIPIDEYLSYTEAEWQEAIVILEDATESGAREWESSKGWLNSLRRFKEEHSNQVPTDAINNSVLSVLISRNGWAQIDGKVINFSHKAVRTYAAPLTLNSKLLAKMIPIGDLKPGDELNIEMAPNASYSGFTCATGTPVSSSTYVLCKHSITYSSGKKGYVYVKVYWQSYSYYASMTGKTYATYMDGSTVWGSYAINIGGSFYYPNESGDDELEGTVSKKDTCSPYCYSVTEELFSCGGSTIDCTDYSATNITSSGKFSSTSFSGPSIASFEF